MASYTAILIQANGYIGSSDITISEGNGVGTLDQLLANLGNEKYVLDYIEIWSDNKDQLMQPIGLINFSPEGNYIQEYLTPQQDVYQFANILNKIMAKSFVIDENSRITLSILANTTVKMTLYINKEIRNIASLTKQLEQEGAKGIRLELAKEIGFREPEELKESKLTTTEKEKQEALRIAALNRKATVLNNKEFGFREPEEVPKVVSTKGLTVSDKQIGTIIIPKTMLAESAKQSTSLKLGKKEKQPQKEEIGECLLCPLIAGLVMTIGVYAIYYHSGGAALFIKK
jgi:hypothetical protein